MADSNEVETTKVPRGWPVAVWEGKTGHNEQMQTLQLYGNFEFEFMVNEVFSGYYDDDQDATFGTYAITVRRNGKRCEWVGGRRVSLMWSKFAAGKPRSCVSDGIHLRSPKSRWYPPQRNVQNGTVVFSAEKRVTRNIKGNNFVDDGKDEIVEKRHPNHPHALPDIPFGTQTT